MWHHAKLHTMTERGQKNQGTHSKKKWSKEATCNKQKNFKTNEPKETAKFRGTEPFRESHRLSIQSTQEDHLM